MSELAQCPVCGAGILKDSYGWRFTEKIRVITYKCFGKLRVGEGEIVTCPIAGRIAIKQQSIISALRAQVADVAEDTAVGRAIREWLDANNHLSICISPLVGTDGIDYTKYVIKGYVIYTCQAKDPIHSEWTEHGIGKDISSAMRAAGLSLDKEAAK